MTPANNQVPEHARELVAKLLANPDTFSEYNDLLSLFFKGLPIATLSELLRDPNDGVIAGALFIAEELGAKATPVLNEIIIHVTHKNPRIRISAFNALGSSTRDKNQNAFVHVVLGMRDADPHCRKIAMLWMMRVENARLKAALQSLQSDNSDPDIQNGLRMLLEEPSQDATQIHSWILDKDALTRKFGMIAAGRAANIHSHLLEMAAQSMDADLHECATAQIRFRALRQRS